MRKEVATVCKFFLGLRSGHSPKAASGKEDSRIAALAPRVRQTLDRMLAGDSEKEIGVCLGVSRHTVHVYVKMLYRHFDVNSRGELLSRFVLEAYRNHR